MGRRAYADAISAADLAPDDIDDDDVNAYLAACEEANDQTDEEEEDETCQKR